MDSHYVLREVGRCLAELVADILEKEFELPRSRVGLGIPGEDSQLALCIFPYDIYRNTNMPPGEAVAIGTRSLREPSAFYDICFMLVPYSVGDLKYRREEELRFLDILLRDLGDTRHLGEDEVDFCFDNLSFEDKARVWNALNQPLRLALYCKVGPIEVMSGKIREIRRVTDVHMHYMEKGE